MKNKILTIPGIVYFDDSWYNMQKYLKGKGNPPYKINGDLELFGELMESLGNLIEVEGGLGLVSSRIKSLGNLETVGGFLDLESSQVESFGSLQSVGGDLFLVGAPISKKYTIGEIRKIIRIGGDIYK